MRGLGACAIGSDTDRHLPGETDNEDLTLAKPASKGKAGAPPARADLDRRAPDNADFVLHSLQQAHAKSPRYEASDEELLKFYEQMLLIRRFEERAGQLYGLGLIGGFCHLYIGQEAVAIGLQTALDDDKDSVITGYRDHGHMLAYGIDPKVIMAELTGREAGISKGKGGSMHMFSTEHKFYGGHGIVGAQVALGGGLALAHQYRGDGGLCLAYFGDGAANQGQVYETFNMAALWKLPIVFAIENNGYAMGTSTARSSAETEFYRRGTAFRIPGMDVNGMDVLEVRAGGRGRLRARARGQRAGADGAQHLSLPRAFDVRSGQVPHARGSAGPARAERSDRACQDRTGRARQDRRRA